MYCHQKNISRSLYVEQKAKLHPHRWFEEKEQNATSLNAFGSLKSTYVTIGQNHLQLLKLQNIQINEILFGLGTKTHLISASLFLLGAKSVGRLSNQVFLY